MKSEPAVYSIDDLARDGRTDWTGVRNYQARNFMRDRMRPGDEVLFYHSSAQPPGVAGLARIAGAARPETGPWVMIPVEFVVKFPQFVLLDDLRAEPLLKNLLVLRRGQRLSIQPVARADFERICRMGGSPRRRA